MNISLTYIGKAFSSAALLLAALLLAALLVIASCSEIQPYTPPNHREEGPAKGLFTGSRGEWVILGPKQPQKGAEEVENGVPQSDTGREQKKDPENSADGEQ
jgi:hypothetical protein